MAVVRTELVPLGTTSARQGQTQPGPTAAAARALADRLLERHGTPLYDYVVRLSDGDPAGARIVGDVLAAAALEARPPAAPGAAGADRQVAVRLFAQATARCLGLPSRGASRPGLWGRLAGAAAGPRFRRPPSEAPAGVPGGDVLAVLRSLSPEQRACVLLREHHGFSYDEIAAVLATSRAAVGSLLVGAREALRRRPRSSGRGGAGTEGDTAPLPAGAFLSAR
jgi:hypothetical protein